MRVYLNILLVCFVFSQLLIGEGVHSLQKLNFPQTKPINLRRFNVFDYRAMKKNQYEDDTKMMKVMKALNEKMERKNQMDRKIINDAIDKNKKHSFLREFYVPRYF